MDLLSVLEYAIKKGGLHEHRYEPTWEEMQKETVPRNHDRFLQDQEFRIRMIEIIEMKFVDGGMF